MWGIVTMGNLANPAHTRGGTVLRNHANVGLGLTPEDRIDVETVPAQGGRADEVILIPKNCIGENTFHIHTDMLTEVRTLPRIKGLTMQLWMP